MDDKNLSIAALSLDVKSETNNAIKGLEKLKETLNKLKGVASGKGLGLNGLRELSSSLARLKNATSDLKLSHIATGISKIKDSLLGVGKSVNGLTRLTYAIEKLGSSLKGLPSFSEKLGDVGGAIKGASATFKTSPVSKVKEIASAPSGKIVETKAIDVENLHKKLGVAQKELLTTETGYRQRIENIKQTISIMSKGAKELLSEVPKPIQNIASAFLKANAAAIKFPFSILKSGFESFKNRVQSATIGIGRFLSSLSRIAMYRTVRSILSQISSGFKEGTNNAYQFSKATGGVLSANMDKLATSMLYFRNSIGAAVAPLINALAPTIDFVVKKISGFINLINQGIASLTGQTTWLKAKTYATEYAQAVGGVSKASTKAGKNIAKSAKIAEDAVKNATLGIDELNIIEKKLKNNNIEPIKDLAPASSGAPKGPDFSKMFEEVPIESKISDFMSTIRDKFMSGDWEGLGRELGNKVNSMFDSAKFEGFGERIGETIDASVTTALSFARTVDFKNVGDCIGRSFNGAMRKIRFVNVGALISRTFTGLIDTVIGFLSALDWGLAASSLSDFFIGLFDEFSNWVDSLDLDNPETLDKVSNKFKDFFEHVKWPEIANSLARFILKSIKLAFFLIVAMPMNTIAKLAESLINKILDTFQDEEKMSKLRDIGLQLFEGIIEGFSSGPVKLIENVVNWIVSTFKDLFGIQSPSKVFKDEIGENLAVGLFDGLKQGLKSLKSSFLGVAGNVIKWFTGGDGKGNIFEKFLDAGKDITSKLESGIEDTYRNVKDTLKDWSNSVKRWFEGSGSENIIEKFGSYAINIVGKFKDGIKNTYETTKEYITTWASSIGGWFGEKLSNFWEIGSNAVNGFKSGISDAFGKAGDFFGNIGGSVSSWLKPIVDGFKTAGEDSASGYMKGFEKKWDKAKDFLKKAGHVGLEAFNKGIKISSPSKLFMKSGEYSVEGYNLGIEKEMHTTADVVRKWINSFLGVSPKLSFATDTSSLTYDLNDYIDRAYAEVYSRSSVSVIGFKESIEEFYKGQVLPVINQIAADTKVQANKEEKMVVNIGNRTIEESVRTQKFANGYNFLEDRGGNP